MDMVYPNVSEIQQFIIKSDIHPTRSKCIYIIPIVINILSTSVGKIFHLSDTVYNIDLTHKYGGSLAVDVKIWEVARKIY